MNADRNVTQILRKVDGGGASLEDDLFPVIYGELKRIAQNRLSAEAVGHTLQATALVNEYYLKVSQLESDGFTYADRRHFFQAAAKAMQHILVDHARRKRRIKRGGDRQRAELNDEHPAQADLSLDLVALDDALKKLEAENLRVAETVRLKFFANMTMTEISQQLEVSVATVERDWGYAKAWLQVEMNSNES